MLLPVYWRAIKLILLTLILAGLLAACADNTPTALLVGATAIPQASSPIEPSNPIAENLPVATLIPTEDPNAPITPLPAPAVTVGSVPTVAEMPTSSPARPANYEGLPSPPPTLPAYTPAPLTDKVLPKNHFVVAARNGLYLLNTDGSDSRVLANYASFSQPKISPDGTQIAVFRTDPINRQTVAYLISAQGTQRLISTEAGSRVLEMVWSPDAKNLALTVAVDTNGDGAANYQDALSIWLYELGANKSRRLAEGSTPVWSPDGTSLLFTSGEAALGEFDPTTQKVRRVPNSLILYTLQNNTKRVLLAAKDLEIKIPVGIDPLLSGAATVRYFKSVAWSPDNRTLATSADALLKSNRARVGLVLTLTPDDTTPRLLTIGGDAAFGLAWSGDGKKLAFATEPQFPVTTKSAFAIGVAAIDTPAKAPAFWLGRAGLQGEARYPQWLDNTTLAYLEGVDGNAVLVVVNSDGSLARRLISGCSGFDWR